VPGLVFFVNLNQHRAHGTSLVSALLLSTAGVVTYAHHGYVDYLLALEIAAGGVVGATFGVKAASALRSKSLRRIFSIFIVIVGIRMILNACEASSAAGAGNALADGSLARVIAVVGTGVMAGFLSALLGIGGGMVMVPAMVILLGVPQLTAQGVSLAAIIPTAFTGMLMHGARGNVDLRAGTIVGCGAMVGAVLGGTAAAYAGCDFLKFAFGGFLLLMALLMALKRN
jgi:uncharacterized membrane protein YfcA